MFCLLFVLVMTSLRECKAAIEQTKFKTWKGYKLTSGTQIRNMALKNLSLAGCANFCTGDCQSVTFSRPLNQCVTFKDRVYDSSIVRTSNSKWDTIYKIKPGSPVQFGDWTLVFRAQRDINQSLYDVWTSTGTSDDNPLSVDFPVECLQLTYSNTCTRHFRSYILDQWTNIDKVKISVYVSGSEVKNILFDGINSTWTSWFTQTNIINSTWGNMAADSNIFDFSIYGYGTSYSERRFAITNGYFGCDNDLVYFMAIDIYTDICTSFWPMTITSFPKFVYAPGNSMVKMQYSPTAYSFADVMTIYVTFTSP